MAIPIIINPAANSTRAAAQMERIRQLQPAPEIHVTKGVGSAREIAAGLAADGHSMVVAAGGDGTVNEVVNGIAGFRAGGSSPDKGCTLGILPVGTMNVMAFEMGLPGRNLEACWEIIHSGATKDIDLWQANDQYFAQLAGVGFDAEIVQQTPWEMKRRYGPLSYVMTAAKILSQESPVLSVEIEGRPPLYGSVVLLGNGRHYGGPVPVFPDADHTDGLLDVLIIHHRRPLEAFQFLTALVSSGFQDCNDIDYLQVKSLKVTSTHKVPYELDGELGQNTPVEFRAAPFKLRVAC